MKIIFKKYEKSDFKSLKKCMEKLQDFLVNVDPLKRLRRLPEFGKTYAKNLVRKITKQEGLIILVYNKKEIMGCIAGIIEKQSKENLLECVPSKTGRVLELFILDKYRGLKLGKKLMQKMENYFKKYKCAIIRIEVFIPNESAHTFYKKLNYSDRVVDMVKPL